MRQLEVPGQLSPGSYAWTRVIGPNPEPVPLSTEAENAARPLQLDLSSISVADMFLYKANQRTAYSLLSLLERLHLRF